MAFLKRLFSRPGSGPSNVGSLDARTIAQLEKAGADLRLSRETLHYLYVATELDAEEARRSLARDGRTIDIRPAATGSGWLVLVTESMIVNLESITAVRQEIEAVSTRLGGEYDGWEAAVTPD